jgi:hypothetical protein
MKILKSSPVSSKSKIQQREGHAITDDCMLLRRIEMGNEMKRACDSKDLFPGKLCPGLCNTELKFSDPVN